MCKRNKGKVALAKGLGAKTEPVRAPCELLSPTDSPTEPPGPITHHHKTNRGIKGAQKRRGLHWTQILVLQFSSTMILGGKNNKVNSDINKISSNLHQLRTY